jgi:RNA polymerase sigma factor for flagellar operon FliA
MQRISRDRLVRHFLPLVRRVAARVASTAWGHPETRDLQAYGLVGLLEAVRTYRSNGGMSFDTYAAQRIRWRVKDGARRLAGCHRRLKEGRGPTDTTVERGWCPTEIAACVRLCEPAAAERMALARPTVVERSLESDIHRLRVLGRLRRAREALDARQRRLLVLVYEQGQTVTEAGVEIGIGRSQASRLHRQALRRLRDRMGASRARPVRTERQFRESVREAGPRR